MYYDLTVSVGLSCHLYNQPHDNSMENKEES